MRTPDQKSVNHPQTNYSGSTPLTKKPTRKRPSNHFSEYSTSSDKETFGGKGMERTPPIFTLHAFNFGNISTFPNQPLAIQPKLTINTPGDKYEQEADIMAEKVMRKEENFAAASGQPHKSQQRKCASCEEEVEDQGLMRKAENGVGAIAEPSLLSQLNASKGSGMPLPSSTKGLMENSFGKDLSQVRVHSDQKAIEMSRGIHAKAFTHGNNIYFNTGEFRPHTSVGKRLLAHELAHTIQQGGKISRSTIQREEKKEGDEKPVTTKVEVVTEHDFSENKTKAKATTTRSAEEKVAKGVTATATEKTSDEGIAGTAEIKAKDKSSGLSVAGGIKAESPSDPTKADSAKGFIKVGGQWTLFDSNLKIDAALSAETDFTKTPKVSADGKAVFFPNGRISPEVAARMVFDDKGVSGKVDPGVSVRITKALSVKAGVPIEVGPGRKLKAGAGLGIVVKF
jgi:hypothetical protein